MEFADLENDWMEESMNFDKKLLSAKEAAIESGRLTPLIKEELWTKIQARRLEHGLNELQVKFNTPTKSDLTEEEMIKADTRRRKNREAAKRCREKRKINKDTTKQSLESMQQRNKHLKAEISRLEAEKQSVISMLRMLGTRIPTPTPNFPVQAVTPDIDEEVEYHFSGEVQGVDFLQGNRTPIKETDLQIVPSTPTFEDYMAPSLLSPLLPPPPPYPGTSGKVVSPLIWGYSSQIE